MIVYRIEGKSGIGIYRNNHSLPIFKYTRAYYEAKAAFKPTSINDAFSMINNFASSYRDTHPDPEKDTSIGYYFYMNPEKWLFGFDSVEQLFNWFPKAALEEFFNEHKNTSNEVFVNMYETDDFHTSDHQVIFNKSSRKVFSMNLADFVRYTEKGS